MGRENNSVKKIEEEERASGIIARNEIRVSAERWRGVSWKLSKAIGGRLGEKIATSDTWRDSMSVYGKGEEKDMKWWHVTTKKSRELAGTQKFTSEWIKNYTTWERKKSEKKKRLRIFIYFELRHNKICIFLEIFEHKHKGISTIMVFLS